MANTLKNPDGMATERPLHGLRVIELNDGTADMCGRLLADLGADVILVEPPGGAASRRAPPLAHGVSLYFASHSANKRSVVLDLATSDGRARFEELLGGAAMLIETTRPGTLESMGLGAEALQARWPTLNILSITDFGQTGPYRDYRATNAVHTAMAGILCRSGLPGMPPLMPPVSLAIETAAVQAAWVALLALWQTGQTGVGDAVDFSIYEGIIQALDPALGVTGSASGGRSALDATPPGRPQPMPLYPIFACSDGHVRMCVLNPRHWTAMSEWLGDHPFQDPMYASLAKRMAVSREVNALIGELVRPCAMADLVREGQRRGIPVASVASPTTALKDEHFSARGAFIPIEVAPGLHGMVPSGLVEVDGVRAGPRSMAPVLGQHTDEVLGALPGRVGPGRPAVRPAAGARRRPLDGIRVLDLGVIVAGAEAGRLLADQGAEVIKIENHAFPDGGRQSLTGEPMTTSIAQGHRNKESAGINLKSEQGRELFKQLVAKSDVVLSNFKPGTLEGLGLHYEVLREVNPGIIMMDSSALGNTGPQSRSMGYGPLVRAATGMTWLWSYPDVPDSFSDGVTIYPDHLAGRVAAIGVVALLMRRARTGQGGTVSVSQAELFLNASPEHYLRESLHPGSFVGHGNASEFHAPDSVYRCSGDDEWCVVSVRSDEDWGALLAAMGRGDLLADVGLATAEGRVARRAEVDALVSAWTAERSPREVTRLLQSAGVPAGFMQRLSEFRADPQLAERDFIQTLEHPGLPIPLPTEGAPARSRYMAAPDCRPAPYEAEHTRDVARRVLGMQEAEIDACIASGALETMASPKIKTAQL